MQPKDSQYLVDMLHSAQRIQACTAHCSLQDFYQDIRLQDSVIRRLLTITKASQRISDTTRQDISRIDWSAMTTLKSRIMGADNALDEDQVWALVKTEIPALIKALRARVSTRPEDFFSTPSASSLT